MHKLRAAGHAALSRLRGAWHGPGALRAALEMFISPVSLLMLMALVWTMRAKATHGFDHDVLTGLGSWLRVVGSDVLVFGGIAAVFAWVASRRPWARLVSAPLAVCLFVLAGLNATFLRVTGEQGSWYDILDAYRRRKDLRDVLEDMASAATWSSALWVMGVALVLALALRIGVQRWLTAMGGPAAPTLAPGEALPDEPHRSIERRWRARLRAKGWSFVALFGAIVTLLPRPDTVQGRLLSKNVVALVAKTSVAARFDASFKGFDDIPWYDSAELKAWTDKARPPNLLLVVLESTRFDHTALAGDAALAKTPMIGRLAKQGFVASHMRSVLPHTTKSMFSMMCAQLPTMQKGVIEAHDTGAAYCLPRMLRDAGYATIFLQSAFGTFEQRPRLVRNFGFESFEAYETIGGQKLGYLASDDASLVEPFVAWKDQQSVDQPWFAMILTSATHHSYRLPKTARREVRRNKRPSKTSKERYARLVEAEDRMLTRLYSTLAASGELENTLVVVVGDHGEGFGDQGVKQHDNNYFEEGLRVPFVIAGPQVEPSVNDADASLLDLTPTLIGLLGLPATQTPMLGSDLLSADYPVDAPKFFGCYDPSRCRGFVAGGRKYVFIPRDDERFWFDLEADPTESQPLVGDASFDAARTALDEAFGARRVYGWKSALSKIEPYGEWLCFARGKCRHPKAWKRRDRYDPATGKALKAEKKKKTKSKAVRDGRKAPPRNKRPALKPE